MDCKHNHLTKVENMPGNVYECAECHNLFDVTLGDVAPAKPVFGVPKEEPC
jgi:hypothetical protein